MYKPSFFITTLTGSSIIWSLHFLPAWRSKCGIWYGNVAGWLGGCPSQAGIVSKRLNPSENFFDHLVAPQFYFPLTPAPIPDSKGNPFSGGVKQMGVEKKLAIFDRNHRLLSTVLHQGGYVLPRRSFICLFVDNSRVDKYWLHSWSDAAYE